MGNRAKQTKEFGGQWYVINAAKNWLDHDLTFNEVDDVMTIYKNINVIPGEEKEDRFERALMKYVDDKNERWRDRYEDDAAKVKASLVERFTKAGLDISGVEIHDLYVLSLDARDAKQAELIISEYITNKQNGN